MRCLYIISLQNFIVWQMTFYFKTLLKHKGMVKMFNIKNPFLRKKKRPLIPWVLVFPYPVLAHCSGGLQISFYHFEFFEVPVLKGAYTSVPLQLCHSSFTITTYLQSCHLTYTINGCYSACVHCPVSFFSLQVSTR